MKLKYANIKILKNREMDYNSLKKFEYDAHASKYLNECSEIFTNFLRKIREITSSELIFGGLSSLEPLAVTH